MRNKILLALIMLGLSSMLNAQDTIQIMQYNLLYYGNTTSYCTSTNNGVDMKNGHFKTIFSHAKPDILTVNEMAEVPKYQDSLLNNALNTDGETKYKRATLTSAAQGDLLVNMLYYNSEKLSLHKQDAILTDIRVTDVYTLFYKAADLAQTEDTLFLTCIVSHLKAGSTSSDQATRASQTAMIMNYIQTNDLRQNYLFMGDFNVQSSTETSYDNLIKTYDGNYYLFDPANAPGTWNNNASFSSVHTQAPQSASNGCTSGGGLDDRFDFILASGELMDGTNGMEILPDTYQTLGNDGLHFNTSLLAQPTNATVPPEVINALYYGSDHLPVTVRIKTEQSYLEVEAPESFVRINFQNPVQQSLNLRIAFDYATSFEVSVLDLTGRQLFQVAQSDKNKQHQLSISVDNLKSGIYFLHLKTANGQQSVHKFFKD